MAKQILTSGKRKPFPLEFKPDMADVNSRWEAYWAGEIVDIPVVVADIQDPDYEFLPSSTYWERMNGDMDSVLDRVLYNAKGTYFAAESVPQLSLSVGPDEIAAFCGAVLEWSKHSKNTNWSKPFVEDWTTALPLNIQEDCLLWQRTQQFHHRAAEILGGKILLRPLDLHTNMDLLSAIRGPERLCIDLYESPEKIDRAMVDARRIFEQLWNTLRLAGRMDEFGYACCGYSMEGVAILSCDFSALIGPDMFSRWVRPALEHEAALVKHAIYHWDGPRALVHFDELMTIPEIHTLAFEPDPGERPIQYIDLFKRIQGKGKSVHIYGTVQEIKAIHKELNPARVLYEPEVKTRTEVEDFLAWLRQHT